MMREMVHLNEKMEKPIRLQHGDGHRGQHRRGLPGKYRLPGADGVYGHRDTVNTASRFSGLAKGRQILATRTARERLGAEFQITQLPPTRVKGKAEEVDVYEINY